MPFTEAEIVGIHGVVNVRDASDGTGDALMLHLLVDGGTMATTWRPLADMARFCTYWQRCATFGRRRFQGDVARSARWPRGRAARARGEAAITPRVWEHFAKASSGGCLLVLV